MDFQEQISQWLPSADEDERLAALYRYKILNTTSETIFDRITALAAHLFEVPVALIGLIDRDRIWFKSCFGIEMQEIQRTPGLWAATILEDTIHGISHAIADLRSQGNLLLDGNFGLRFYAAAPLQTPDGHNIGVLCVVDQKPRSLSHKDQTCLHQLAELVIAQLELRLAMDQAEPLLPTVSFPYSNAVARASPGPILELSGHELSLEAKLTSWEQSFILIDWSCKVQAFNEIANHQLRSLFRKSLEIGDSIYEFIRREDVLAFNTGFLKALNGYSTVIERLVSGSEMPQWLEFRYEPLRNKNGKIFGVCLSILNIDQQKQIEQTLQEREQQLSWQASHDAITGLLNRNKFETLLEQAILSAKNQQHHVLCNLNLDQFKLINDSCGYLAGDELLCQVATIAQNVLPPEAILARLNGDEFGILLHHCSLETALDQMDELRQSIRECRFVWGEKMFVVSASIGLVAIDGRNNDPVFVLNAADAACRIAKTKGRDRSHIYQPDDQELIQRRGETQWVTRITQALEDNAFRLYYQPVVPTNDLSQPVEYWEVLLRYANNSGELILPTTFIPAAERYNFMQRIDQWVIQALFASETAQFWRLQQEQSQPHFAINLSGASVSDDRFIDFLKQQFTLYGIPPQMICFEITETAAISNLGKAAQLIRELKKLGCRFALDDFGSGMSSFGYLKNLPVDYLKIDGNFVKNILEDPIDLAMVEAINHIGHVMGIKTIAEFVTSHAILAAVRNLGVDYVQGHWIAKPTPLPIPKIPC